MSSTLTASGPRQATPSHSAVPTRKVAGAGIGGALATLIIFSYEQVSHQKLDPSIASAITVLVSFVIGYVVPS